jgi:hypothetical protein
VTTRKPQKPTLSIEDPRHPPRFEVVGRMAALAVSASTLLLLTVLPDGPVPLAVITLAVTVSLAWWLTSGFWKTVALGAAGGVLAGLMILGPGWRVVMRMVAVWDPSMTPDFTIEGTVLTIILMLGALGGGVIGIVGNLARKGLRIRTIPTAGFITGVLLPGLLLTDGGLRGELTDLGGGLWINLPMFGTVAVLYGMAAMYMADRLEARFTRVRRTSRIKVSAK